MKQVLQNLRTGATEVVDVPAPALRARGVLMTTTRSLVSAGTERMLVDFGRASLIGKVRRQPERVREVLDKIRTDGLFTTIEAVQSKLDQPLALGYCATGIVAATDGDADGLRVGERIVANSPHAEIAFVPRNLCARIPDGVEDDAAAFTVIGAIALQGIRLANPTLGETVVVIGLGLIGLMAVQLLVANGCRVVGVDSNAARIALAKRFGATTVDLAAGEDPVEMAIAASRGRGVDAVIVAASTTSSDPVSQAARMSRKRGRIVLVGVAGLELSRAEFYEKELSFQVSCSYGPGRYDPEYEAHGNDYPIGFVRWTEQRNFEAVLDMMASGAVDPRPLISHRFAIAEAREAYDLLAGDTPSLGILLSYHGAAQPVASQPIELSAGVAASDNRRPGVSVIGAGNYAGRVFIPALAKTGAPLRVLVSSTGVSAVHHGKRFGFVRAATDTADAIEDAETGGVVIATRHDSHAGLTARAIQAGRAVYVEKPLAIDRAGLNEVREAVASAGGSARLMVGFNRRFSPLAVRMRELLSPIAGPKTLIATVNAGAIPANHWTQDPQVGGGRIVGEACHFVDLLRFLVGAPIVGVHAAALPRADGIPPDTVTATLRFDDGSIGTIHYFADGHRSFPKERIEAMAGSKVLALNNFLELIGYGFSNFKRLRLWRQDKGHAAAAQAFVSMISSGILPTPLDELFEISRVSIEVAEAAAAGEQAAPGE
jgi:predicted dehydrogenase